MGKITDRRVHDIVTGALDLMDYTRHQASVLTGPLNLGVIPSIAPYLLPRALAQLQERFPGLQLKLRETLTDTLVKEVSAGRLDVALISLRSSGRGSSASAFSMRPSCCWRRLARPPSCARRRNAIWRSQAAISCCSRKDIACAIRR